MGDGNGPGKMGVGEMKSDIVVKLYCQECNSFIRDIYIDPNWKNVPEIRVPVCPNCCERRSQDRKGMRCGG